MIRVWPFARSAIFIASIAISVPVLVSGTLRSTYVSVAERKMASIWPPQYAFVGDSITTNCNWRRELGTWSVLSLAVGGSDIRDISHQVYQALQLKPAFLAIEGGINDVLLEDASSERIADDFNFLLRQIPASQKVVITLIPFVSSQASSARIAAANSKIIGVVEERGFPIIDLNRELAADGVRKPEMTTDGVHFTQEACRIWSVEIETKSTY